MRLEYSKEAVKHIEALDRPTRLRIKQAIEKLPGGDVKKLVGYKKDYRLRVGNLRILFYNDNDVIIVKDVLPRGEAYKRL